MPIASPLNLHSTASTLTPMLTPTISPTHWSQKVLPIASAVEVPNQ